MNFRKISAYLDKANNAIDEALFGPGPKLPEPLWQYSAKAERHASNYLDRPSQAVIDISRGINQRR